MLRKRSGNVFILFLVLACLLMIVAACRSRKMETKDETPAPQGRAVSSTPVPQAAQPAPDPSRLLEEDLAAGVININQASRYRIYRLFRPSVVPEKYRYREALISGTWDILQVTTHFGELDSETAKELLPYLVRSTDPRSIYYERLFRPDAALAREEKFSLGPAAYADESPVKEVYHTDTGYFIEIIGERGEEVTVKKVRQLVEKHKIYERFERLLGRKTRDYGDGTLAITIVDVLSEKEDEAGNKYSPLGITYSEPWFDGSGLPRGTNVGSIAISASLTERDPLLAFTLSHEIFHCFQFAFSYREEKWLMEGSAIWAADFIGHDWNLEQAFLFKRTFNPDVAVHNRINEMVSLTANGQYLLFYYLTRVRSGGGEAVMRSIWENCLAAQSATLVSVKKAVGGDFAEVIEDYALNTLDEGEVKGKFPDAVGSYSGMNPLELSDIHRFQELYQIDQEGRIIPKAGVHIQGIGISYYQVTNAARGSQAPTVRFDLKEFKGDEEVGLAAIVEYPDGHTEREDWGDLDDRVFCLSQDSQNFQTIYLAASYAKDDFQGRDFKLDLRPAEDVECVSGQLEITVRTAGQMVTTSIKKAPYDNRHDQRTTTWRQEMTFTLDLVPETPNTKAEAGELAQKVPTDVREMAMSRFLQPAEPFVDEDTNCLVFTFRVKNIRENGFSRTRNLSGAESQTDAFGLVVERRVQVDEHWSSEGLCRETEDWLKEESLKIRVYIDRDSNAIKWVRPAGPIGLKAKGTRWSRTDGRRRIEESPYNSYRTISGSNSEDLEEDMLIAEVSERDKDLPMNEDWKARSGSQRSAQGEGRLDRPLEYKKTADEGVHDTRTGQEVKTIKWRLTLAVNLPGK